MELALDGWVAHRKVGRAGSEASEFNGKRVRPKPGAAEAIFFARMPVATRMRSHRPPALKTLFKTVPVRVRRRQRTVDHDRRAGRCVIRLTRSPTESRNRHTSPGATAPGLKSVRFSFAIDGPQTRRRARFEFRQDGDPAGNRAAPGLATAQLSAVAARVRSPETAFSCGGWMAGSRRLWTATDHATRIAGEDSGTNIHRTAISGCPGRRNTCPCLNCTAFPLHFPGKIGPDSG